MNGLLCAGIGSTEDKILPVKRNRVPAAEGSPDFIKASMGRSSHTISLAHLDNSEFI
jgi:hypothetical protein